MTWSENHSPEPKSNPLLGMAVATIAGGIGAVGLYTSISRALPVIEQGVIFSRGEALIGAAIIGTVSIALLGIAGYAAFVGVTRGNHN
jgi:hypothetical protein